MSQQKSFELILPKGMRDLDPQDKILQMKVLDTIRTVYELYGYAPLETPIVERMDVLTAKFAAGEGTDVSKEIFHVMDQGDRELGLRFDHTVPLCRYVAMNPTVKLPFKRYVMGQVFRDGPIKLGRYREFWQADADMIGVPGILGDCEGVMMAAEVFQRLGLEVVIKVGSREILNLMMEHAGIPAELRAKATIALDKIEKIGAKEVLKEMKESGIDSKSAENLLALVKVEGGNEERLEHLEKSLGKHESIQKMRSILATVGHLENVVYDPSLARGLQYYTGFVYECFLKNSKITSSLIGSGRFDRMVGQFLGAKDSEEYPGVGLSFGVSVICDALREKGTEMPKSLTKVYVVPVSENERGYALEVARTLRGKGINTDMDLMGRTIGKNFGYADALGIPYVVVVGGDEAKDRTVTIKDMKSGDQKKVKFDEMLNSLSS